MTTSDNVSGAGKGRALSKVAINNMHHAFDAPATSSSQAPSKGVIKSQANRAGSKGHAVLRDDTGVAERVLGRRQYTPSGATQRFIEQANEDTEGQNYDGDDSDEEEDTDDFTYEESRWMGSVPRDRLGRGGIWTPVDNEAFWNHTCVVGRTQVARSLAIPVLGTMPGYGTQVPFWAQTCRAGPTVGDTEWDQMRTRMRALMGVQSEWSATAASSLAATPHSQSSAPVVHKFKHQSRLNSASASTPSPFIQPVAQPSDRSPVPNASTSSNHLVDVTADSAQEVTVIAPAQPENTSIAAQHLALFAPTPTSIRPSLAGMVSATPEWFVPMPVHHTPPPSLSPATMLLARFRPGDMVENAKAKAPAFPSMPATTSDATTSSIGGLDPTPDLSVSLSNDSISSMPLAKTPYNLSTEDMGQVSISDKRDKGDSPTDPLREEEGEHEFRASLASLMSRQYDTTSALVRPIARRASGAFLIPARAAPSPSGDSSLGLSIDPDGLEPRPNDVPGLQPTENTAKLEESSHHDVVLMAKPSRIRVRPRQRASGSRPFRGPLGPAPDPKPIEGIPSLHRSIDQVDPSTMSPLLISTSRLRPEVLDLEHSVDNLIAGSTSRLLAYPLPPAADTATAPSPHIGSSARLPYNSLHSIAESPHEGEEIGQDCDGLAGRIEDHSDRIMMPRPSNIPGHHPPTPLEAGLYDDNPFYVHNRPAGSSRSHRLAPRGSDDSLIDRFEGLALESPERARRASWHMSTADVGTPPPSPLASRFSTPLAYIAEDEEEEGAWEASPSPENDPRACHVREAQRPVSSLLSRFAVPMADIIEEEEEEKQL